MFLSTILFKLPNKIFLLHTQCQKVHIKIGTNYNICACSLALQKSLEAYPHTHPRCLKTMKYLTDVTSLLKLNATNPMNIFNILASSHVWHLLVEM